MELPSDGFFSEGKDPRNQASLRSSMDLPHGFQLDLWGRYVDKLPFVKVDSYFDLDVRLAWKASKAVELAVIGQNLVQSRRFEWGDSVTAVTVPTAVERSVYFEVSWRF